MVPPPLDVGPASAGSAAGKGMGNGERAGTMGGARGKSVAVVVGFWRLTGRGNRGMPLLFLPLFVAVYSFVCEIGSSRADGFSGRGAHIGPTSLGYDFHPIWAMGVTTLGLTYVHAEVSSLRITLTQSSQKKTKKKKQALRGDLPPINAEVLDWKTSHFRFITRQKNLYHKPRSLARQY